MAAELSLTDALHGRVKPLLTAGCAAFLIFFSLYIMTCFIFSSDFFGMNDRSPQAVMEGKAARPLVYRQLMPTLVQGLVAATPGAVRESVTEMVHEFLWHNPLMIEIEKTRHPHGPPPELDDPHLYTLFVIALTDYLFVLGYFYLLWRLARRLFPQSFTIQLLAPLLGGLSLPAFCGNYGYMYDFPVLFFSAWLALLLQDRRFWWFTGIMALATFNKETTIYMIALFLLIGFDTLPRKTFWQLAAAQVALYLAIRLFMWQLYASQPDDTQMWRRILVHGMAGLRGYTIWTLLGMGAGLALFTYRWQEKPLLLRRWLVLLPLMVVAWLLFGNPEEYRVFYEIFPCLTLLAAHTLATALKWTQGFQGS